MGNFNRFDKGRGDNKFGGRKFGERDNGPRQMHKATCGDCGQSCEVPFRPTGDRPVFCSNCFKGKDGGSKPSFAPSFSPQRFDRDNSNGISKAQIEALHAKLDKIIFLLGASKETEASSVPEIKKTSAKKTKAPAKKVKASKK